MASGTVFALAQLELFAESPAPARTTSSLAQLKPPSGSTQMEWPTHGPGPTEIRPTDIPSETPVETEVRPTGTSAAVHAAGSMQVPMISGLPLGADDRRVAAVRSLLAGMPLAAYSSLLVSVSDNYGIDWRLLPVISILESSGGSAACGGNAWGYAACRVRFGSFEEGAQVVARTLASPTYAGKDLATQLCIWVSGHGCTDAWSIGYAQRAAGLFQRLGGYIAVPAAVAVSEIPPYGGEDTVAAEMPPPETSTPLPAPSTTPSPSPTATASATPPPPSATATATAPPATATPSPSASAEPSATAQATATATATSGN